MVERGNSKTGKLQILEGNIVGRMMLASMLGYQYGGDRNMYQALGYPESDPQFKDYLGRYLRQDIANAVISRPVSATWLGALEVLEAKRSQDTSFEDGWKNLNKKFGLKQKFARLDKLTGIGEYGVLVFGLDDVQSTQDLVKPVRTGKRILKYVKPFSSESAKIATYEQDPKNERYGLPTTYDISVSDATGGLSVLRVHYTRVLHILDDALESDIKGEPRLKKIYNRLMDLDKVLGGAGEMFWRGARPGFQGKIDKDFQLSKEQESALLDQIDEYEHHLRRFLLQEGVEWSALQSQVSSPANHFGIIMQAISSAMGIPLRILMGSERGELASTQDTEEWLAYIQTRRDEFAEISIVRPFIDRCIELKILPEPSTGDYSVKWSDLYAISERARVDIGKARANAIREYTYNPLSQEVMPQKAFLELCLGLSSDQIDLVTQMLEDSMNDEETQIEEGTEEVPAAGAVKIPVTPIQRNKIYRG